jgi:hypothetical protein
MHDLHMTVRIHHASADDAGEVHRILHEAFAEYGHGVTPPTYLLDETVEDVRKLMMAGGALLGYLNDVAVGAARYQIRIDHLHAERVAVVVAALLNRLKTGEPDFERRIFVCQCTCKSPGPARCPFEPRPHLDVSAG